MTNDEILKLTSPVFGLVTADMYQDRIIEFARLIEAATREECAVICESSGPQDYPMKLVSDGFAAAIRKGGAV